MTDINIYSNGISATTVFHVDLTNFKTVADLKHLVKDTYGFPPKRQIVYCGLKQYVAKVMVADMCAYNQTIISS